ncbi:MAG: 50S ribosomal protein L9, partial [SAR202 cluster bacterium]|nr:50S ribosomal protein L9 [SAR202 cluster bacterium]|tara:strand:+ start:7965 stop:8561 length:597 start_codon:yes stop_codon:yes gene_type:complete
MKVVFLEDVDGVAKGGEIKEVKNGFARNYLIPKNLAAPATHNQLQRISKLSKKADEDRVKKIKLLSDLSESLNGIEIKIEMRAASNDRLYGSVTGTMIADAINEQIEGSIGRQLVQLDNPIREVGSYPITVRLHDDISATVTVIISATGSDILDLDEESDVENASSSEDIDTNININEESTSDEDIVSDKVDNISETE